MGFSVIKKNMASHTACCSDVLGSSICKSFLEVQNVLDLQYYWERVEGPLALDSLHLGRRFHGSSPAVAAPHT